MAAKPKDLQDTAKPDPIDNNYYNLTILDLDPSITTESYLDIQLAWLYKDITKGPDGNGISPYSTPIRIPLPFEALLPPKFISTDLTVYQGKLKVNWQGLNNSGQVYDDSLDYIDILYRVSGTTTWISAGIFKKAGFILIPGIPKESYNVKLVAHSKAGKVSDDSDIQTITLIGVGPNKPLNVVGAWSGTNFKVTFNQDPAASGNEYLSYHKIELTSSLGDKKIIEFPLQTGTSQKFELSEADSNKYFGPQTAPAFSGKVWSVDIYSQEGDFESFGSVAYVSPLTAPTITVTELVGGYSVAYTDQLTEETKKIFNNISIEESLTGSTSGFSRVSFGSENPVTISTGVSLAPRWVRALVYDNLGGYPKISGLPAYSNVATVTPATSGIDLTAPAEVTISSAQWVTTGLKEEIQIAYTIPSSNGGAEFEIFLTNGSQTRSISEYPEASGLSQIAKISKIQLQSLFGTEYPTSFTGVFKSLSKVKVPSTGTSFNIAAKGNALSGVTPVATPTAMINGFSISWDLGNAKIAKVYTSTTSGFTPNESLAPQYYGAGPYIQNTSLTTGFSTVYFKVKFFGDTATDLSNFSAQGSVTPINPDSTDTTPPPTITSVTGVGASNLDDPSGISGQITLTLVQPTMPADFAGYSVKIINGSQTWYQEFASATALTTLVVKNGIYIGQSYTLSVATRDKTNLQSYISCSNNPIAVNDTRANSSVVTNLAVAATDSIATVSWTAPADNKVGSYRVMITTNADTAFATPIQTIYTDSSQTSFGGLTSSTAYRVRVTTKYSNSGSLSTANTDLAFTLNASGSITDGNAPTKNPGTGTEPAIVVKSLFKAFTLTWSEIPNADDVTYEVYVKTVNSTGIVDPANLVMEINGTFAVINALKDGTAIAYPAEVSPTTATNYYFAIRAKDADGISSAAVTPVGPFTASRTGQFDIATNAIYANHITAGQINADKMVTDLLFAEKTINVGESTSLNRVRLDAVTIPAGTAGYTNPSAAIKSRIFIGAGKYNDAGTAVYADNLGRFSLTDKLQFDGANLQINANGSFGGLLTAGPAGQEIKIGLAAGGGTNHGVYFASTADYLYNSGNFRLGAGKITYNGTLLDIASQVNITGSSTITGDLGVVLAGATFYAGASKSTGNRVLMNSTGLFGYSGATANFSFPNSTGLFSLGAGDISGWSVSSGNIEKSTTVGATTTYSGMSAGTGTSTSALAFYAGGGSAGSGSPKFKVTHGGVMTASGVVIQDGQLDIGAAWPTGGFHVSSSGVLQAKGADIRGAITIEGASTFNSSTLQMNGGAIIVGASLTQGSRVKIDSTGIKAFDGNSTTDFTGMTTNISAAAGAGQITFSTEAARLGSASNGWLVGSNVISNVAGAGSLRLESSATAARILAIPTAGATSTGMGASDATYAFWAGAGYTSGNTTNAQIAAAPFSVTHAGAIVANNATIRGVIKATSGGFGTFDASGNITSGFTLTSGILSSSTGLLVINGTTGAITGGSITGTTVTSSATAGKGKVQLDGTNSRILFNSDQTYSFSLDSDTTSVTTYSYSYGTDSGADAGDGNTWYGAYYGQWATPVARTLAQSEAISLKRTDSTSEFTLNNPRLTLSIGGATYKSFLKISNQGSGPTTAAYSSVTLQEGGLILTANYGALKIENMASAPHYSWTSANYFRINGVYLTGPTREVGVPLVIKSDGSVSTGRAIFKTGASEATLTSTNGATNSYMYMGQDGDIMFSTSS